MSKIEWVRNADGSEGKTWNPIRARNRKTGRLGHHCEHVHEGCRFCYAERLNRNARNLPFGGTGLPYKPGYLADVEIFVDDKKLLEPLSWRAPQRVFVNSMDDLYGHWVTDAMRDKVFAVMAMCPQHTFIIVTKRPEEQRAYLTYGGPGDGVMARIADATGLIQPDRRKLPEPPTVIEAPVGPRLANGEPEFGWCRFLKPGPLKNVWGLVSCSTQEDADKFVPILLNTPLAKRGVSLEPLLGHIILDRRVDALHNWRALGSRPHWAHVPKLDWVIAGGESGSKGQAVRPMDPDWVRSLRDSCKANGIPFFFKQWGEWLSEDDIGHVDPCLPGEIRIMNCDGPFSFNRAGPRLWRVGKNRAGRKLDGVEHNEWPEV